MTNWTLLLSTVVLAGLLLLAVYFYQFGAPALPLAPAQPTLLLVGPSGSGKTALFQQLVHDKPRSLTYTTQRMNVGTLTLQSGGRVRVLDAPGHPKLFSSFKSTAPTLVTFVLDASTFAKSATQVTRQLVDVVAFARLRKVEVAVLANKSDLFTALQKDKLVDLIESEVEELRRQKDGGVRMEAISESGQGGEDADDGDWLSDLEGPFKLQNECQLFAGSVIKDDVTAWQDWVEASF